MTWLGLDLARSVFYFKVVIWDALLICFLILLVYTLGLTAKWFPFQYKVEGATAAYVCAQVIIPLAGLFTSVLALYALGVPPEQPARCNWAFKAGAYSYCIMNSSLYFWLYYRSKAVQFNRVKSLDCLETLLYLITFAYPCIAALVIGFGVQGIVIQTPDFAGCVCETKWWASIFVMFADSALSVGFLYLFVAPFRKLPLKSHSSKVAVRNLKMSLAVLLSTFLAMLVMTLPKNIIDETTSNWACHLDVIINNVSIFWGTIWAWSIRKKRRRRRRVQPKPELNKPQTGEASPEAKDQPQAPWSNVPLAEEAESFQQGPTQELSFQQGLTQDKFCETILVVDDRSTRSPPSCPASLLSPSNPSSPSEEK
eukprot:g79385.t1